MSSECAANESGESVVPRSRSAGLPLRSAKVQPVIVLGANSKLIEVRPKRFLRIYHSRIARSAIQPRNETGEISSCSVTTGVIANNHSPENPDVFSPNQNQGMDNICSNESQPNSTNTNQGLCNNDEKRLESEVMQDHDSKESTTRGNMTSNLDSKRIRTASSVRCNISFEVDRNDQSSADGLPLAENDTAVFLLHGVGGSVEVWSSQIAFLEKLGYEAVAFDFVGHGFSCSPLDPEAYTFKEISEDVLSVFDQFRKTQNILIGHSYGHSFYATGYSDSTYDSTFSIPSHVLKYTMIGQEWMEGNIEFHSWIMMPTLLIHGKQDQFVSIEEVSLMKETVPGSQLFIIEDAGHMVMIEKSEEVNRLINEFITSAPNNSQSDVC